MDLCPDISLSQHSWMSALHSKAATLAVAGQHPMKSTRRSSRGLAPDGKGLQKKLNSSELRTVELSEGVFCSVTTGTLIDPLFDGLLKTKF